MCLSEELEVEEIELVDQRWYYCDTCGEEYLLPDTSLCPLCGCQIEAIPF